MDMLIEAWDGNERMYTSINTHTWAVCTELCPYGRCWSSSLPLLFLTGSLLINSLINQCF